MADDPLQHRIGGMSIQALVQQSMRIAAKELWLLEQKSKRKLTSDEHERMMSGEEARKLADISRLLVQAREVVGNHFDPDDLSGLTTAQLEDRLRKTTERITAIKDAEQRRRRP